MLEGDEMGGKVRAEGERRASRSMVTSVALRGFVGVANVRLERRLSEGHGMCGLAACLRRAVARGRPLVIILSKAGQQSTNINF
jgi:hypothetical protein